MTITADSTAPLLVIAGSTGTQGFSIVKALTASKKAYRIRGLTRDINGSGVQKLRDHHVEPYGIDFSKASFEEAAKAFEGADYVFGLTLTNYAGDWDRKQQYAEGKLIVDGAKAAGIKLFLWSGVDSYKLDSKGKYSNVLIFEVAYDITRYLAEQEVPTIVVQPGSYANNLTRGGIVPNGDGTYNYYTSYAPDTLLPYVHIAEDYGLFVQIALETDATKPHVNGEPDSRNDILSCSELISSGDMIRQLGEETGKTINFVQVSDEQYTDSLRKAGRHEDFIKQYVEMQACQREFGYYGEKSVEPYRRYLARPTYTWREYVRSADWSSVFGQ